jgi:predicted GTPase
MASAVAKTAKSTVAKTVVSASEPPIDIPNIPGAHYILVVGETGTGKSTFINTVINRFRGGNLTNPPTSMKIAIPNTIFKGTEAESHVHTERGAGKGGNTTESQTVGAVGYILDALSLGLGTFVLVDTPGLGDTAGVLKDDQNVGTIL